ncbi:hypothetical protein SDC9_148599 [bioreactor metagenome]|uniref:Uncharacterized protein n=1 Tax=bioreactor metagenome TaxID=1076179 RepID=A0A645EJ85_9ZZZZ
MGDRHMRQQRAGQVNQIVDGENGDIEQIAHQLDQHIHGRQPGDHADNVQPKQARESHAQHFPK